MFVHYRHFLFTDTATTEIYTLSLHDALPIWIDVDSLRPIRWTASASVPGERTYALTFTYDLSPEPQIPAGITPPSCVNRSEEHTSELQSRRDLVCRLLLEKKKTKGIVMIG